MANKIKFLTDIVDKADGPLSRDDICYSIFETLQALYTEDLLVIPRGTAEINQNNVTNKAAKAVFIPYSVKTIGADAFYNCNSLTSVTVPDSVTTIGNAAFSYCRNLTSVTIGDSVIAISDYVFRNCFRLKNVTIGNSVKTIGYWSFVGCEALTNVIIPSSVTEIKAEAFSGCINLTNITYTGTVSQWNGGIAKGLNWDSSTGNYVIICTDGTITKGKIEAGTYKFNDTLELPSAGNITQDINFIDEVPNDYKTIDIDNTGVIYILSNGTVPGGNLYNSSTSKWGSSSYQTITLSNTQSVSEEFYMWFINNSTRID